MNSTRAYIYIHIAVFLFGFTGILGKGITLESGPLVWYRMAITLVSLLFFPKIIQKMAAIPWKTVWYILGVGTVVAAHWVTFFAGIKFSNVSIALSCMGSVALFTSILEPILLKKPFRWQDTFLGVLVIVGLVFIFGFTGEEMYLGIFTAILSAFLAALFGTLNKDLVSKYDVYAITAIEFIAGVALLSIALPIYLQYFPEVNVIPSWKDLGLLLVLALLCTTLAFTLTLQAMKVLSAFSTALAINLEPIYAILIAAYYFSEYEQLNLGFYAGAVIIVLAVFLNPVLKTARG